MSASPHPAPSRSTLLPSPRPAAHPQARPAAAGGRTLLPRLLAAWHLLSLDAPTVAALWVVFIARSAGLVLPWTDPAAMFVAIWILYAADRLLDARLLDARAPHSALSRSGLEHRHRFHHEHRAGFSIGLVIACPLLVALLRYANPAALKLDVLLGALLFAWLFVIHLRSSSTPHPRLPKELAVGVFFPAAIFIPTVARVPSLRPALLPDALLFAAVCSLNCLYIFAWEHPHSRRHAHWTTRWAVDRLQALTAATLLASAITAALFLCSRIAPQPPSTFALPAIACTLSATFLLLLHRHRQRLAPVTLRAAADLCLLTPALLLLTHI